MNDSYIISKMKEYMFQLNEKIGTWLTKKLPSDTMINYDLPWNPMCVGRILRTFKIKKNVEVTCNDKDDF